ncbi:hypothetical protein [Euzebyella saccharophila]|uniref:LTXXQ motif family protein n=1 Tax=Euzebyella saccharophila TaxID=679664 RepID=A0ABV8K0M3_9FLAO|nr:hypothetical protein [Euzebyella saccharophila]
MKRAILILMCLVGFTAMAQKGERHQGKGKMDLTPEQIATLQTKKMTLALDLDEKQQKKIMSMNLERAEMRKAKMEERKAARDNDEAKRPTAEEKYVMQNERLDQMIAHKAEMKDILSEEQFQKWEKMRHHQGRKMKKRKDDRKERHSRR